MKPELWWALGIFAALVVIAALVNALAPARRASLRRSAILFLLYVAAVAAHEGVAALGHAVWAGRLLWATELLRAFTCVSLGATLLFDVTLPRVGFGVPTIARDLLIGLAYVVATLGVLSGHGLTPGSILATSAVISAVIAISLQGTLGNVIGGVALQLDGSIKEGDWIQLENGRQGRVRSIRWRHTVVETRDWSTIIVPNAQLLGGSFMILGRRAGREAPQRMWVWFNVDYRWAPSRVIDVVTEALRAAPMPGVAADPPPNVVCMDFTRDRRESMATYAARYWLTDLAADDPTSSLVRARVYTALARAGIPLAVPAQTAFVEVKDEARTARREERRLAQRLAALATVPLFRSFTAAELEILAAGMSEVIYTAGEVITRQGARANWLYVMTSGSAEVRTTYDPDGDGPAPAENKRVAVRSAPDFFGEMGLMTGEPREADVIAVTDVECFRLGRETFERVLLARPAIAEELSHRLAARRLELSSVWQELDVAARQSREDTESARIVDGIKRFFGL